MSRPLFVDWYCCEGGTSMGYHRAGFDVVGADLFRHRNDKGKLVGFSRKRYPFPAYTGDALAALDRLLAGDALPFTALDGTVRMVAAEDVAASGGSPPCQHASAGTRAMRAQGDDRHPALIEPTRERLQALGVPYVIENVSGAALVDPLLLCWSMFGNPLVWDDAEGVDLRMERHRLFESNVPLTAPRPCDHLAGVQVAGSYGAAQRTIAGAKRRNGGYVPSKAVQQRLLGVDWMTERGMHQCIPPAYTEHIGRQLLDVLL